jgi:hypothetical protein
MATPGQFIEQSMVNRFNDETYRREAHKQALSDQQFQEKHNEIQGMIDNLGTKLAAFSEDKRNTPDYLKMQDQYAQAIQSRDAHWKSMDQPNALSKFGKMLGKDLRFKKQAAPIPVAPPVYGQPTMDVNGEKIPTGPAYKVQGPQTPAQMRAAAEAAQLVAAGPVPKNDLLEYKKSLIGAGFTPEQAQKALEIRAGLEAKASPEKRNYKVFDVPGVGPKVYDMNDPESIPEGAVPHVNPSVGNEILSEFNAAKAAGYTGTIMQFKADSTKSKAAQAEWTRAHYGGRDMDQLSPEEADQAMAMYQQEKTPTVTSTGQALVYDNNNQPHVFTHTGTSTKSFPGAKGAPSTPTPSTVTPPNSSATSSSTTAPPKTIDGVKKEAAKINPQASSVPKASKSPIGPALDFKKMTPEITAANKLYQDAVGLVDYADKVQKHPNNAQEQRDFAIKMERVMSGRFQTAAYDLEVKNSGIANTFQQWINDISTGALPQQIVDHLVQSAHDYKDAMAKEVEAAKGTSPNAGGASGSDIPKPPTPTKPGPKGAGMAYNRTTKKWHWSTNGTDDLGPVE